MVADAGNFWNIFFENAFKRVKDIFNKSYPITDEEEASPQLLALRDAVFSLPCAVKVLEIRVDTEKHKHIRDEICQLIGYDFSVLGKVSIEYWESYKPMRRRILETFSLLSLDSRRRMRKILQKDSLKNLRPQELLTQANQISTFNSRSITS